MPLSQDQLKLVRVRLSFPDLFKPKAVEKDKEPKYGAVFLLNKNDDAEQILVIRRMIWNLAKGAFGEKAKTLLEKGTIRICLHEGAEKDYDGYGDDVMYLSTSSKKRPAVVDRDRSPLAEDDQRPYAGCYVNAVVRLWVQDNQYGKRVNAQLQGVQFVADGEAFGAAPLDPDEVFDELEKPKAETGEHTGGGADPDDDDIPF